MNDAQNLPVSFWVIAAAGLAWNLIGLAMYYLQVTATPAQLATSYSPAEVAYLQNIPAWANAAYGLAVTAGVLGCIALLLRRGFARVLLALSLIGIVAQNVYGIVLGDGIEVFGYGALVLPILVLTIGIALLIYAGRAKKNGLLF